MTAHTFRRAKPSEADALADLRVKVMRPSLETVGRFDAQRAKHWFLSGFDPDATWIIEKSGLIVGLFTVWDKSDHLYLDHLYIEPDHQGGGIGRAVVDHVKSWARREGKPIHLIALEHSPANGFYTSLGFQAVGQSGVDISYEWHPTAE